jgi:hypothetical protein
MGSYPDAQKPKLLGIDFRTKRLGLSLLERAPRSARTSRSLAGQAVATLRQLKKLNTGDFVLPTKRVAHCLRAEAGLNPHLTLPNDASRMFHIKNRIAGLLTQIRERVDRAGCS